jgi:hypothetical protein
VFLPLRFLQKFNEYKKSFPNVILAGVFGFSADAQNLEFSENLEQLNEAPKDLISAKNCIAHNRADKVLPN